MCSSSNNEECIGLGIVRSIDEESNVLHIVTPVAKDILKERGVDSLVAGRVFLPVVCCNKGGWSDSFEYLDDSPLVAESSGSYGNSNSNGNSSKPLGDNVMKSRNNIGKK